MRTRHLIGSVCAIGLLVLAASAAAQDGSFRVIVNSSNPAGSLRSAYVSELFLGKIRRWDHGGAVAPVDRSVRSSVRAGFSKSVHHKSVRAVQSYWQQRIFSGRGVPPPELHSDAEVVAYVQRNPGAIGYVSGSASLNKVRVVEILK